MRGNLFVGVFEIFLKEPDLILHGGYETLYLGVRLLL